MQARENLILSITPILKNKLLHTLNVRPDWFNRENINKKFVSKEINRSKYGQQDIPKYGQRIIQRYGKSYIEFAEYETTITQTDFVEKNIDEFVRLCSDCFTQLTQSDCESIGTQFPTVFF